MIKMPQEIKDSLITTLLECMKVKQEVKMGSTVRSPGLFTEEEVATPREIHVRAWLKTKIPELQQDTYGNLYLINEGTPLICAHMDTVGSAVAQENVDAIGVCNTYVGEIGGTTTYLRWEEKYKQDNPNAEAEYGFKKLADAWKTIAAYDKLTEIVIGTHNIGADDKCGIAMALELYKALPGKVSLLFTVGEETGMGGVRHFVKNHQDLLEKCTYCVLGDRRNGGDVISTLDGYCTQEFIAKVLDVIGKYGFAVAKGLGSDAGHIKPFLNCINMSVGYYNAHQDTEYVVVDEYVNSYNAMYELVSTFNEKLDPPVEPAPVVRTRSGFEPGGYNTYSRKTYEPHELGGYSTTYDTYDRNKYNKKFVPAVSKGNAAFQNTLSKKQKKVKSNWHTFDTDNIVYVDIENPIIFDDMDVDKTYMITSGQCQLYVDREDSYIDLIIQGKVTRSLYNVYPNTMFSNKENINFTKVNFPGEKEIVLDHNLIIIYQKGWYKDMGTADTISVGNNRMYFIPKGRYMMSEDSDLSMWKALYDLKLGWKSQKKIWNEDVDSTDVHRRDDADPEWLQGY